MEPMSALIYIAVTILLTVALTPAPKVIVPTPESFEDFDFPQADEGTPQAVFFGECWSSDWTVLGTGNFRTTQIMSSGGGK
jgi:hypothetical protein